MKIEYVISIIVSGIIIALLFIVCHDKYTPTRSVAHISQSGCRIQIYDLNNKDYSKKVATNIGNKCGNFRVWELRNGALLIEHGNDSIEIKMIKLGKRR